MPDPNLLIGGDYLHLSAWARAAGETVTPDVSTPLAPDGSATADRLDHGTSNQGGLWQAFTFAPSTEYTISVYQHRDSVTNYSATFRFRVKERAAASDVYSGYFSSYASTPGDWQRRSFTFTTGALAALGEIGITHEVGVGLWGVYWGIQLVTGNAAQTYVRSEPGTQTVALDTFSGGADGAYPSIDRVTAGVFDTDPFTQRLVIFDYNLLADGDKFNSPRWIKTSGATVVLDQSVAPSGFRSADTLTVPASTSGYVYQKYKLQPSTQYTASFYACKVSSFTGSMSGRVRVWAQTVELAGSYTTITTTWKRITYTFTTGSGVNGAADSEIGANLLPGDVAIWGYQLVPGGVALDYQEAQLQTLAPDYTPADRVFGVTTIGGAYGSGPFVSDDPNLLTYGDPLHAVLSPSVPTPIWTKSGANSWANDVEVSPRGDTRADVFIKASGNDGSFYQRIPGAKLVVGYTYTASIYAKLATAAPQSSGTMQFRVRPHTTGSPELASGYFGVSRVWQRYTFAFTVTSLMVTEGARVMYLDATDVTAIAFWGAQVVPGSEPLPYVLYPFVPFIQPAALASAELVSSPVLSFAAGKQTIYPATIRAPRHAPRPMGMNLATLSYYTPEWIFPDLFKTGRAGKKKIARSGKLLDAVTVNESSGWISATTSIPWNWNNQVPVAVDGHGWVIALAADQSVYALMMRTRGPFDPGERRYWPDGLYVCTWDGEGSIEWTSTVLNGTDIVSIVSATSNRAVLNVAPRGHGVLLKITATNPANYIRNIRFWMPGFEGYPYLFHPKFLDTWRDFPAVRFMSWQLTNASPEVTWDQRAQLDDAAYGDTSRGMPLEVCIALANELHADAWVNIPAMADVDYATQMATMLRDTLDPSLRIYVEYTNEFWNGGFLQGWWLGNVGEAEGLQDATKPSPWWEGQMHAYARNAGRAFNAFDQVFSGPKRLLQPTTPTSTAPRVVRVLGGMRGSSAVVHDVYRYAQRYTARVDGQAADAYTSNYYFGNTIGSSTQPVTTLDQIFSIAAAHIETIRPQQVAVTAAAAAHGLRHVIYEGGPHLAQPFTAQLTMDLIVAASRDPRMAVCLAAIFADWQTMSGDLFFYFESTGSYGFFGAFPLLEDFMTAAQSQASRAKYSAVLAALDAEPAVGAPALAERAAFTALLMAA